MGHYNWVEPMLTPSLTPAIMVWIIECRLYCVTFHYLFWPLLHTYPCDVIDPEQPGDDIIICGPGQQLHCHGSKLLHARLRPVLQTRLREGEKEWLSKCIKCAIRAGSVSDGIIFFVPTYNISNKFSCLCFLNFIYKPNLNHGDPDYTINTDE